MNKAIEKSKDKGNESPISSEAHTANHAFLDKRKVIIDVLIILLLVGSVWLAISISKIYNLEIGLEIGLAGGFIVFAFLLWKILSLYLNANEYTERKDFVDLHAKILGSAALVISLIFTWQGIKNNQIASLLLLQNTEKQRIEDRYSKALEQLGNEKIGLRVGAIYSLGKIASDSILFNEKLASSSHTNTSQGFRDFHWEIMQTLNLYVRANAPLNSSENNQRRPSKAIPTDIQAALSVLAWRDRSYQNGEEQRLELYGTDLRGLVLKDKEPLPNKSERQRANFEGAQLYDVDFEDANLRGINFKNAILINAIFKNAYLAGADLTGAELSDANLESADLGGAKADVDQIMAALNWERAKRLPHEVCKDIIQRQNIELPQGCK